jgi:hypothetical protein
VNADNPVMYGVTSRSLLDVDLQTGSVDLMDTPDMDYVDPNWASLPWHTKVKVKVVQYFKNW